MLDTERLARVIISILLGGVIGALAGMFLFFEFLFFGILFFSAFVYPTPSEILIEDLIGHITFSIENPLRLVPDIGLGPGLAIGLIAGLRGSRYRVLILRAALGGVVGMIVAWPTYLTRPGVLSSAYALFTLLGTSIAEIDLIIGDAIHYISSFFKRNSQ